MSKYTRTIFDIEDDGTDLSNHVEVDVYEVLEAFKVTCPARQHAIKKILCAGLRGEKDSIQDLIEAQSSLGRAISMEMRRVNAKENPFDTLRTGDHHSVDFTSGGEIRPGRCQIEPDPAETTRKPANTVHRGQHPGKKSSRQPTKARR